MKRDTHTASTTAHDCDRSWIATKIRDIRLNPSQCHNLILESIIAGRFDCASAQESQGSQTVIYGDQHNILVQ